MPRQRATSGGLSLEQLADALYYEAIKHSNIAHIERGQRAPNQGQISYHDGQARAFEEAARMVLRGVVWTGEPLMRQEQRPARGNMRPRRRSR